MTDQIDITNTSSKTLFTGCDGKKYAFPVGCKAHRAEAHAEAPYTLDGWSLQPALQWKELERGGTF